MHQLQFEFYRTIARKDGIPRIDGWPVLGGGGQSAWISRRHYPGAEEALGDARLAVDLTRVTLYVVRSDDGLTDVWPDGVYWTIRRDPPFTGVAGAFYHSRPDFYAVAPLGEFFSQGESKEVVKKKERQAREDFEKRR